MSNIQLSFFLNSLLCKKLFSTLFVQYVLLIWIYIYKCLFVRLYFLFLHSVREPQSFSYKIVGPHNLKNRRLGRMI